MVLVEIVYVSATMKIKQYWLGVIGRGHLEDLHPFKTVFRNRTGEFHSIRKRYGPFVGVVHHFYLDALHGQGSPLHYCPNQGCFQRGAATTKKHCG